MRNPINGHYLDCSSCYCIYLSSGLFLAMVLAIDVSNQPGETWHFETLTEENKLFDSDTVLENNKPSISDSQLDVEVSNQPDETWHFETLTEENILFDSDTVLEDNKPLITYSQLDGDNSLHTSVLRTEVKHSLTNLRLRKDKQLHSHAAQEEDEPRNSDVSIDDDAQLLSSASCNENDPSSQTSLEMNTAIDAVNHNTG